MGILRSMALNDNKIISYGMILFLTIATFCGHKVEEGHVGIYYQGGVLQREISYPGYQFGIPFITTFETVQVTSRISTIKNVSCGTNEGIMITFDSIEVVHQLDSESVVDIIKNYTRNYEDILIKHRVPHKLNLFCSRHTTQEIYIDLFKEIGSELREMLQDDLISLAPGLKIHSVTLSKPNIPRDLVKNLERIELEATNFRIAAERQKVLEKEAEVEMIRATLKAEKEARLESIRLEKRLIELELLRKIALIENEIHAARQKNLVDEEIYKLQRQAEINNILYTPEYIEVKKYEAITCNPKIMRGADITNVFPPAVRKPQAHECPPDNEILKVGDSRTNTTFV
ncbi:erlin-2-B [Leptinotarsa decemlineata]|uniref:erlin-2-B n=1 Tax=Leptinotarsa decemlineata TaxID=7539 RepID=UPI003D30A928